jgi:hypothetical protein
VLDIETLPDVKVEVMRLEFADAEEVSTMLNDLIGNVDIQEGRQAPVGAAKGTAASGSKPGRPSRPREAQTLAEAVAGALQRQLPRGIVSGRRARQEQAGPAQQSNIQISRTNERTRWS